MLKNTFGFKLIFLSFISLISFNSEAQKVELLKYGNFQQWVVRELPQSKIIGGGIKTLYEIGPTDTIYGDVPYKNMGGSPWATSNVFAKVMGVCKGSNAVFPSNRGSGNTCAKLTTMFDSIRALGIVNIEVLVGGSIFLGEMVEPIRSSSNPYSKMVMGVPFTRRPSALQFDYRMEVPDIDYRVYCSGFSKKKTFEGRDSAEVFIILQRRWEDSDGKVYAKRVGTGRERFFQKTDWINSHRLPVLYGDITSLPEYKPWMGLIPEDKCYYTRNSKGKMVPVHEIGWDDPDAIPTHLLIMASSACGTAYIGTPGMTLYVDNMSLVY